MEDWSTFCLCHGIWVWFRILFPYRFKLTAHFFLSLGTFFTNKNFFLSPWSPQLLAIHSSFFHQTCFLYAFLVQIIIVIIAVVCSFFLHYTVQHMLISGNNVILIDNLESSNTILSSYINTRKYVQNEYKLAYTHSWVDLNFSETLQGTI